MSLRGITRLTRCYINTVTKILVQAGNACAKYHDMTIRNIKAKKVQCDEIWSFVYCKKKNVPQGKEEIAGDLWTWVCIDADTKLIISYFVGGRTAVSAKAIMKDLAERI